MYCQCVHFFVVDFQKRVHETLIFCLILHINNYIFILKKNSNSHLSDVRFQIQFFS